MLETDVLTKTEKHDLLNLDVIARALDTHRIDSDTAEYLRVMYSNGMDWFREVFHFLGKCLGAPKTAVVPYDIQNMCGIDKPMKISDINPLESYLVQHRLDADPMRNQFFESCKRCRIDLSVSSIVTVIVGAEKNIGRAINKITGKYYNSYVEQVVENTKKVFSAYYDEYGVEQVAAKVKQKFESEYITKASEVVLEFIEPGQEKIAVDLVRTLDKIKKPYSCLCDVWRAKCLFDLIPQARTFIERMRDIMPDRILEVRDRFYDVNNPRNYRDAKIIINIGKDGAIVPMEIICQVRHLFEFDAKSHAFYERVRKVDNTENRDIEKQLADFVENGVKEYNLMIVRCLDDLFDRVGWNILYSRDHDVSMFEGFPHKCPLYYPQYVLSGMIDKLDNAVENEIFQLDSVPAKLTKEQQLEIFHFMARFVLISAMPYLKTDWDVQSNTISGKLFNFVMKEIQRFYKNR